VELAMAGGLVAALLGALGWFGRQQRKAGAASVSQSHDRWAAKARNKQVQDALAKPSGHEELVDKIRREGL
jgi:hypothetical protein